MADDCIGIKSSSGNDSNQRDGANPRESIATRTATVPEYAQPSIAISGSAAKRANSDTAPNKKTQSFRAQDKLSSCVQGQCIGIDLGTTMSAVAYMREDGRPESIRSEEGELTTPSVVYFDDSRPLVGRDALRAAEFDPTRIVRFAKRHLGDQYLPKQIENRRIPPVILQAILLRNLKSQAELSLGPVASAAITVPAYFNEPRRQATRDAGLLAGFRTVDIINEPTAAAIAFGLKSDFASTGDDDAPKELVMVYDLGGGTFDVSVMEYDGRQFDAIATAGDSYLGGMDWDRRLIDFLADRFQQQKGIDLRENRSALLRLSLQAEEMKKSLTAREKSHMRLGVPGNEIEVGLSRSGFESLTRDLLDRTIRTCRNLLENSGLEWPDLSRLILVGGSTRMPAVKEQLQVESGLPVDLSLSPDEAVAHGAAIYADSLSRNREKEMRMADPVSSIQSSKTHSENGQFEKEPNRSSNSSPSIAVNNISSHDLGVIGVDRQSGRPRRQIMIPKNSRLPAAQSKQFLTAREGQKNVVVQVVEGGDKNGNNAMRIGQCVVADLPKHLPQGTCVLVTFRYTPDGRLSVDATLPDIDVHASTSINRLNGLDQKEVEFWTAELERGLMLDAFSTPNPRLSETKGDDQDFRSNDVGETVVTELDDLLAKIDRLETGNAPSSGQQSDLSNRQEKGIQDQDSQGPTNDSEDVELQDFFKNLGSGDQSR